jgi:hypothetical protein
MSYPYLFEHKGEIYCIPEIYQAREVCLYKAEEFPHKWVKVATLIKNIAAVDSTVFEYQGRWWLTCSDFDQDPFLTLFVWHAPDLFGPWEPHACNPVKIDIGSARPAGTPFVHNGQLYRPAQDSSKAYGGRIIVNRVVRLTPTEFKEEQVAVIEPEKNGPYPDGVHTISSVGNFTLIDGKRFMFSKGAFRWAFGQRVAKIRDSIRTLLSSGHLK